MSIPKDLIDYFPNVSNKFMNKFWNKLPIDDTKAMLLTGVCKLSKKEIYILLNFSVIIKTYIYVRMLLYRMINRIFLILIR